MHLKKSLKTYVFAAYKVEIELPHFKKRDYLMIDFENKLQKCQNDSEKNTALLFKNLGFECIDLNLIIKDKDGNDIGEIDGVFLDTSNQVIIIYDDSVDKDANTKIIKWFSKWTNAHNESLLLDSLNIPCFPIHIIYIDRSRDRRTLKSDRPYQHVMGSSTSILFKDDINYFSDLQEKIGVWAKNDLYNFIDIHPPLNRVEVDVIQIYLGDYPAYVYADRADKILNYSYISRRRGNEEGYQRMVDYSRIKEMAKKLKNKEINGFPNSILLNSTICINDNPLPKSRCPQVVKISLPSHYSSCRVVDGQHRLLSFTNLDFNDITHFNIPVVLVDNMPFEDEIKLFLDINNTTKRVDPSLRYELISKADWEEDSKELLIKRAVHLIEKLEKNSPLKGRVYRGIVDDNSKLDKITLKAIVDSILSHNILDIVAEVSPFEYIKQILISIQKQENNENVDYFFSNRGVDLIFGYIQILSEKKYNNKTLEVSEDANNTFINIVNENIQNLRKFQGAQGFKNAIEILEDRLID